MAEERENQQGTPDIDRGDDVSEIVETFRKTSPSVNRRDVLRWSAIAAGAVAMGRSGVAAAGSHPAFVSRGLFQSDEIEEGVELMVPFDPFGQVVTLDPHRTVNWGPFWVMFPNVWSGLLRYDENGAVLEDLAESYSVSDDGLTYTFTLKPDLTYANGNPVVAGDFITSWKRALDPANPSPMVDFFSKVKGYRKYLSGESDEIGFAAPDETTVTVEIAKPYSYFPSLMAAFVWDVVDPAMIEEFGDDFPLNDAGTGPWRFTEFDPASTLVMEPNTNHYAGNSPSLAKLSWVLLSGPEAARTALDLYRSDEVASADVPLSLISEVEADDVLSAELFEISPQGSSLSIGMDFNQEPFNDVRVRRAVAQSIDRDLWASDIWEGSFAPASSFTPPVLSLIANYEAPEGLSFDADSAKALLAEAGFENPEDLPEIVYYQAAEESDSDKSRAQALLDMIRDNSGIDIRLDTTLSRQQISDLEVDNGGRQFDVVGWWNLWDTPHILNEVGSPDSPYMRGVFNWDADNETAGEFDPGADASSFESLCDDADLSRDEDERNALFAQAEELLLANAVYVPLGYWVQRYVQKPWLLGTKQGPWTGRLPVWFDAEVVVSKRG